MNVRATLDGPDSYGPRLGPSWKYLTNITNKGG